MALFIFVMRKTKLKILVENYIKSNQTNNNNQQSSHIISSQQQSRVNLDIEKAPTKNRSPITNPQMFNLPKPNRTIIITASIIMSLLSISLSLPPQQHVTPQTISLPSNQVPTNSLPTQSIYTEDITEFKSKKYNQRLQSLVGCWLLSKEYLDIHKSNYLFFKDLQLKETVTLKLVKECMKRIVRKDAILKITELVGKNMEPAKKYEELIPIKVVDAIFDQVSKLTIANYNHYRPINEEEANSSNNSNNVLDNESIGTDDYVDDNNNFAQAEERQATNQAVKQQSNPKEQSTNPSQPSQPESSEQQKSAFTHLSQFDHFLVDLLKKYNEEFQKLATSKQGLRGRVEEQLKKRQKYYFGFIPATQFTHSVFLVTFTVSVVFCCTCYKYYKKRVSQISLKRQSDSDQCDEGCRDGRHAHAKDVRKMAKMTQLTMKKKVK